MQNYAATTPTGRRRQAPTVIAHHHSDDEINTVHKLTALNIGKACTQAITVIAGRVHSARLRVAQRFLNRLVQIDAQGFNAKLRCLLPHRMGALAIVVVFEG